MFLSTRPTKDINSIPLLSEGNTYINHRITAAGKQQIAVIGQIES